MLDTIERNAKLLEIALSPKMGKRRANRLDNSRETDWKECYRRKVMERWKDLYVFGDTSQQNNVSSDIRSHDRIDMWNIEMDFGRTENVVQRLWTNQGPMSANKKTGRYKGMLP